MESLKKINEGCPVCRLSKGIFQHCSTQGKGQKIRRRVELWLGEVYNSVFYVGTLFASHLNKLCTRTEWQAHILTTDKMPIVNGRNSCEERAALLQGSRRCHESPCRDLLHPCKEAFLLVMCTFHSHHGLQQAKRVFFVI